MRYGAEAYFGIHNTLFSMAESVFHFTSAAVFSLLGVSEGFAGTKPQPLQPFHSQMNTCHLPGLFFNF